MVSTDWLTWFGLIGDVTIFRLAPWTPSRLALPRKRGKKTKNFTYNFKVYILFLFQYTSDSPLLHFDHFVPSLSFAQMVPCLFQPQSSASI